ncbi:hypothetical protein ACP4OV_022457 [Aristida adscensionis]
MKRMDDTCRADHDACSAAPASACRPSLSSFPSRNKHLPPTHTYTSSTSSPYHKTSSSVLPRIGSTSDSKAQESIQAIYDRSVHKTRSSILELASSLIRGCSSKYMCKPAGWLEARCTKIAEQPEVALEQPGQAQQQQEEDDLCVARTSDGSVDWNGSRCLRHKSGGWPAGFLILLNQALVTLAVNGISINLVTFMSVVMRLDNADAANRANNWAGATYVFSILGALISDSYWGRYKACVIFQLICLAGLLELSISSHLLLHRYCDFGDGGGRQTNCRPPTKLEAFIIYISIYQIALGNGAYQPAITTFGADQFDEADIKERKSKAAFFGYFFVANNLGSLFSVTALTYIEDNGRWVMAFWISTGAALVAVALFAIGTLRYRHFMPSGNAVLSVCQVIVASVRKRHAKMPQRAEDLYEVDGAHSKNGGRKMLHTSDYRCLDKAAVITDAPAAAVLAGEQHAPAPSWSLCPVTQVEEVKCILRLVPIWLCSIIYSTAYSQMSSVFIEQAGAMDNSLSKFKIPPAGISIFEIVGVTAFVFIYRFCIAKPCAKIAREPTELQRMGVGLLLSTVAMLTSGLVEQQRLRHAATTGGTDAEASSSLTILWQIPQYILIGASEVFMYVTMTEFFNDQLPEGLRSLGSALSVASMSAGNYASSLLVTLVTAITCRGDRVGWIPQDLNKGHVDWFFFLIAALNAMDFLVFLVYAKRYRPPLFKIGTGGEDENGLEVSTTS